jgi:hypothetical protein
LGYELGEEELKRLGEAHDRHIERS